ncbi:sialidase family protein [Chloroflexus sp.]|uniref:sialidase family protein n=1 Tax=Chloroflexus sp. TaxID=1904827 RepID=UPI003D0BF9A8
MSPIIRTTVVLMMLFAVGITTAPAAIPLAAQSGPQLMVETVLPNSFNTKLPQAAIAGDQVYLFGIPESSVASEGKARVWGKNERDSSFSLPATLGTTTRTKINSEYVNGAIATAPNGEVYALWIDQEAKIVRVRKRDTAGNWGPVFEVNRTVVFPVRPALAVVNGGPQNGRLIAVWRDDSAPNANNEGIYYTYSDTGGATWAPVTRAFGQKSYKAVVQLATGTNGEVVLTFTRDAPRPMHISVALWMGSGFSAPVDVNVGDGEQYVDSSVAIANGRIYVGYRHVDNGIFYAEKPLANLFDNQPWPRSRLLGEKGDGQVSVSADPYGNLHFSWIRTPAGGRSQNRLGYAVRLANGTFLGPIESATSGSLFNTWGVSSANSGFYMHVAHEMFDGGFPYLRYALFKAPGSPFGSPPLIEGGASRVGGDGRTSIRVTFPGLEATPQNVSVRWRWGAPPTDTENDSGGWVVLAPNATASTELTVPIPAAFLNSNDCTPRTLYTQLRRNPDNIIESREQSASVIIDTSVAARVEVQNPLLYDTSSWYASNFTVRDLDPGSTPLPQVMLRVIDDRDCSQITRVRVANSSAALAVNTDLDVDDELTAIVPLPGFTFIPPSPDGYYPVVVRVYDALGNSKTITKTIRLDRVSPQLSLSGSEVITVTDSPMGDILQDITFDLSTATLVEANGIIGVLIAVSPNAVTNPATASTLQWIAVPVDYNGGQFTVSSWSVANAPGVTMATTSVAEQTFYLYIRLIDRAGNIGDTILETTATSTLSPVRTFLPLTLK